MPRVALAEVRGHGRSLSSMMFPTKGLPYLAKGLKHSVGKRGGEGRLGGAPGRRGVHVCAVCAGVCRTAHTREACACLRTERMAEPRGRRPRLLLTARWDTLDTGVCPRAVQKQAARTRRPCPGVSARFLPRGHAPAPGRLRRDHRGAITWVFGIFFSSTNFYVFYKLHHNNKGNHFKRRKTTHCSPRGSDLCPLGA